MYSEEKIKYRTSAFSQEDGKQLREGTTKEERVYIWKSKTITQTNKDEATRRVNEIMWCGKLGTIKPNTNSSADFFWRIVIN
jgi:hypothetical protein